MQDALTPFVKEALEKGQSRESIREILKTAGWDGSEVQKALASFADLDYPVAVPRRTSYTSARESFLYLVMFMTLGISAISTGTIAFQLINKYLPDPLAIPYDYSMTFIEETIRNATASLIIAFPIFLWMNYLLARTVAKNPDLRLSRPKVIITYLTLFVASAFLIGSLIALVNNVLGGELTLRFSLKILTILVIAGGIFWYYLSDLRSAEEQAS